MAVLRRVLVWNVLVAEYGCSYVDWGCVMSFDDWWKENTNVEPHPTYEIIARKAYEAGQRDMRERAANVCDAAFDELDFMVGGLVAALEATIRALKLESEQ